MIKLTNVSKDFEGPLLINPRYIMSVFSRTEEVDGAIEVKTVVYSATQQGWDVKESVNEVYDLIEEAKKS
jgi:hypothetical protein